MASRVIEVLFNSNTKGLKRGVGEVKREVSGLDKTIRTVGAGMIAAFGTRAVINGLRDITKAASVAQETFSKFDVVYRDVASAADNSFKQLVNSYGLGTVAAKDLLSSTGDLLTGFGFSQQAALNLSTEVNKLAVDLASFTNFSGGAKGASEALTKALLGERESVKSLGISILEEDVKKQVAINTAKGLTFESERQAKAFATLEIATSQSKNAIGDYERTSDSFANQSRLLKERLNDLQVTMGELLLPTALSLTKAFISLTGAANDFFTGIGTGMQMFKEAQGQYSDVLFGGTFWEKAKVRLLDFLGMYEKADKVIAGISLTEEQRAEQQKKRADAAAQAEQQALEAAQRAAKEADEAATKAAQEEASRRAALGEIGRLQEDIKKAEQQFIAANSEADRVAAQIRIEALEEELNLMMRIAATRSSIARMGTGEPEEAASIGPGGRNNEGVAPTAGAGLTSYRGIEMGGNKDFATFVKEYVAGLQTINTETEKYQENLRASAESMESWQQASLIAASAIGGALAALVSGGKKSTSEVIKQALSQAVAYLIPGIIKTIPFPANLAVAAGAPAMAAMLFNKIPAFADGAKVTSPTMAMFGEYPGAATNPEYALREDQLMKMMGGGRVFIPDAKVRGQDIYIAFKEAERRNNEIF